MGSPRNTLNFQRIKRNRDEKSYRDRKGGISDDAWKDLSKKEKKKMKDAGLRMNRWREDPTLGDRGRKKHDSKRSLWEGAAWEMGMGNVKSGDDLKKLFKKYEEKGFNNFNSMNDVKAFNNTAQENIDKSIEDGINSRWEEFMKNKGGEGGEGDVNLGDFVPQVMPGSEDWQSQYVGMMNDAMQAVIQSNRQSPWVGNGPRTGWSPRGGW